MRWMWPGDRCHRNCCLGRHHRQQTSDIRPGDANDRYLLLDGESPRGGCLVRTLEPCQTAEPRRDHHRTTSTNRGTCAGTTVSQPRIVAIEKSRNVTIGVLDAYVSALGGRLEVSVVRAGRRTRLLGESTTPRDDSAKSSSLNALNHRSRKRADSAESAEKPTGKTLLSGTRRRNQPMP